MRASNLHVSHVTFDCGKLILSARCLLQQHALSRFRLIPFRLQKNPPFFDYLIFQGTLNGKQH
jgi:hypothetical protein